MMFMFTLIIYFYISMKRVNAVFEQLAPLPAEHLAHPAVREDEAEVGAAARRHLTQGMITSQMNNHIRLGYYVQRYTRRIKGGKPR